MHSIQEMSELREYIARDLDVRINLVIENKLNEWFKANIKELVDKEIKEQFKKMMVVKFGE